MPHRTLRQIVGNKELLHVPPETSVLEATRRMAERQVAAVLITEAGRLEGIFTERDLLRRVIVAGLAPETTPVGDVMSRNPVTIAADQTGTEALRMMAEAGIRHLIVEGAGVEGFAILSMRDFMSGEVAEAEREISFQRQLWEDL
ncbi:MAG: CBS domain-containing protein [Rhodospirillaceae bacterium]